MRLPVDSATQRALSVSENTILRLRAGVDRTLVRTYVAGLAHRFNRTVRNANLVLHGLKPYVTKSRDGRALHQRVIANAIATEIAEGTREPIPLDREDDQAEDDREGDRPGDRDPARLEHPHALPPHARGAAVPGRDRPGDLSDSARPLRDRRQVEEPVVVSAERPVGRGREADSAGAGQPARHPLDGPQLARRRHPRHARVRVDRLLRVARLHPHAHPAGGMAVRPRHRRHTRLHRLRLSHVPHAEAVRPGDRSRRGRRDARAARLAADAPVAPAEDRRPGAGVLAEAHRRQRRRRSRRAAREAGRAQLLGVVVRPVQGRGAPRSRRRTSATARRESCSSASTTTTSPATRARS